MRVTKRATRRQGAFLLLLALCLPPALAENPYATCTRHGEGVPTNSSPITGFNLNGTGLCDSNWCCEYVLGGRPSLTADASIAAWVLICVFGALGAVLYVASVLSSSTTSLMFLMCGLASIVVSAGLGVDLLVYQLAVNQTAFGQQWRQSLKPLLIALLVVDGVIAAGIYVFTFCSLKLGPLSQDPTIAAATTLSNSAVYGVVALCVLVIIPQRIRYDGVSGTYFTNVDLSDQAASLNRMALTDANTLVDVLLGLLIWPMVQNTVYTFIAFIGLLAQNKSPKYDYSHAIKESNSKNDGT